MKEASLAVRQVVVFQRGDGLLVSMQGLRCSCEWFGKRQKSAREKARCSSLGGALYTRYSLATDL